MRVDIITVIEIDVSKYKSTVATKRSDGEAALLAFYINHDVAGIKKILKMLHSLDGEGGESSLRKVKTDKADALKIANYSLTFWMDLMECSGEAETRQMLKNQNQLYERTTTA